MGYELGGQEGRRQEAVRLGQQVRTWRIVRWVADRRTADHASLPLLVKNRKRATATILGILSALLLACYSRH